MTGELPGAPHPGTRYPRRPRDLGSGRLAVTGDRRPARDELARRGRLLGVLPCQPLPGRGAGRFLVCQQRVGVVGGVVEGGELVVDPGRILGRSRDRQLHLVGAAVSVLAGEGVPVDLAPGEPGEAESRAETGQGGALGLLAGEQQGRVGLADQRRQLAGNGQQRGAVRRHRGGEHVAGLFEQRPDLLRPQAGQHRGVGGLLDLGAQPFAAARRAGEELRHPLLAGADSAQHRRPPRAPSAGRPSSGEAADAGSPRSEGACPGPGRRVRRTGAARCRPGLRARSTCSRSRRSVRRSARSHGNRAGSAGRSSAT